jgi:hypothetical protein
MAQKTKKLIPVSEFAKTFYNRRGFPVSTSYIYRLIRNHKAGDPKPLPFEYEEIGQIVFIINN